MSDEMKKYFLSLREIEKVGTDYYIFNFEMPEDIQFTEGQYGVFMHVDKQIEGRKVRAFSVASSNKEDVFKIATKIVETPSDFKAKMLELKPGDQMTFDGPMGSFTLEKNYHVVLIAGGIGITPIRSLVKQIEAIKLHKAVELVYSEPRKIYPFQDEFDHLDFLDKHYANTVENTRENIANVTKKYLNSAYYYISGSPSFVNAIAEQIREYGIETSNIKFDRFNGY
ncbi:MAG: FAD-dependent oxidoreductase [Firmicutes bacterium]|nr:FAD-dependent oxidoreductase [Bacillota bacterium]